MTQQRLSRSLMSLDRPPQPAVGPRPLGVARRLDKLPAQPWPLLGREAELAGAEALLMRGDVRLVTLTGPGGTGKTRLAVELAARLADRFAGGTVFVDIVGGNDAGCVTCAISDALGVGESEDQDLAAALQDFVGRRELLLVLDNFEQALAAAPEVADLLAACPNVVAIATSRAPLRLRWEREYPVPPLPVPDPRRIAEAPLAALRDEPALALFAQRAEAVDPSFRLTAANVETVASICRRLDGLPLAIELAAARVKLFPPETILRRLTDGADASLSVLGTGPQDVPARQRTLRDTIAWSDALLSPEERRLLHGLAVFVGGFTADAAEVVAEAGARGDVLDRLAALADRSLVKSLPSRDAGGVRFGMLQTIREYGLEQLAATGQRSAAHERHAHFFLGLAEAAEPHLTAAGRQIWLARLEDEDDNLQAALEWAAAEETSGEVLLRLATALWWFWYVRGHASAGLSWLQRALATPAAQGATAQRARALHGAAMLASRLGNHAETGTGALAECIAIYRRLGDRRALARALVDLGMLWSARCKYGEQRPAEHQRAVGYLRDGCRLAESLGDEWTHALALIWLGAHEANGDAAAAARLLAQSAAIFDRLGDTWGLALARARQGDLALQGEDLTTAKQRFEEALVLLREEGDKSDSAAALNYLGEMARQVGDYDLARSRYEESLRFSREVGQLSLLPVVAHNLGYVSLQAGDGARAAASFQESLRLNLDQNLRRRLPECLIGLASVAAVAGRPAVAVRLFGAATAALERFGTTLCAVDAQEFARYRTLAQRALGGAAFSRAWHAGRLLSLDDAVADAVADAAAATAAAAAAGGAAAPDQVAGIAAAPPPPVHAVAREAPGLPVGPASGATLPPGREERTLTPREREVARLVAQGLTNRQVAAALVISERTAANHVDHILTKLGFRSRAQIAAWAAQRQLGA